PLNAVQVEQLDEMLQTLFDDLRRIVISIDDDLTFPITAAQGGTGITTYVVGDMLYANTTSTLGRLNIGTANYVLKSNGTTPVWSLVGFTSLIPATAESRLIGRGEGSGAGNFEEITLGTGLTMVGTELRLNASATDHVIMLTGAEPGAVLTDGAGNGI